MSSETEDNIESFKRNLTRLSEKMTMKLESAFNRAGLYFIGQIQERWYSGRKEDDTGLYVHTNGARDGWFPKTEVGADGEITTTVTNNRPYAKDHEFGKGTLEGVKASPPKKEKINVKNILNIPNLPQRTFVRQDFNSIGKKIFITEAEKAIKETVSTR